MKDKLIKRNNIHFQGRADSDRVMMLIHGYGCDQNMWRFVTPAFAEDFRIVLLDLVGCGQSDSSYYDYDRYDSLDGYAEDILEICEAFELQNVTLVGHSVSSMISLLAALKRPDLFENLIMVGPSPCYINDNGYNGGFSRQDIEDLLDSLDSNYLGWSQAITPVIMGNPERPELSQELTNSFCQNDPEIARHFARVTFLSDNRDDLPNLEVRTLVLQCSSDVIAPVSVGQYVHQKVSNSEYVQLQATGHCPHLSEPEETIKAMKAFLQ